MQPDTLGERIAEYRTSPVKVIVLVALAMALAGLAIWLWLVDRWIGEPVALVCVPAAIGFLFWAYATWVQRLEILERGIRLRFVTRQVEIAFSNLAGFGPTIATVNGTAQGANGIWFERIDGSTVVLPLSTNVDKACQQIASVVLAAGDRR